jgi:hypothetical protein
MFSKICHYTGILLCILIILACFLPWVHYNSINETFTGFYVKKFTTDNYYGRAGMIITYFTSVILLLFFIPKIWAKRINLFLSALLFAYCIRTYIIFTGSLFEGEVENRIGIYLILIFSFLIMVCSVFPKVEINPKRS